MGGDSADSTAGIEDGFKARLIRQYALHFELSFQLPFARQRDMKENDPIARHRELQLTIVAARLRLSCVRELRTHSGVRHIRLDGNVRSCDRLTRGIGHFEHDRCRADPYRLRQDFRLNRNRGWRVG
jgi:hypothetical protein